VINFQGTGIFYWFDFVTAFFAVVLGAVVLSAAGTITDFIAINLMRCKRKPGGGYTLALTATSQVLRAKRVEQVSPDFVMAAQSMVVRDKRPHAAHAGAPASAHAMRRAVRG
jgi:hypothetical protein